MNEPEAMPGSTYQGAALTSREHADGDTIMANLRCSYTEKQLHREVKRGSGSATRERPING